MVMYSAPLFSNTIHSSSFNKETLSHYIIHHKTDSALALFKTFNENYITDSTEFNWYDTTYLVSPLSSAQFTVFFNQLISIQAHSPIEYHNYLKVIKPDPKETKINTAYLRLKLFHFNYTINMGLITEAEEEFNLLTNYLKAFNENNDSNLFGEFIKNHYQIMMAIINHQSTMGYTRIEQNILIANQLNNRDYLIKTLNQKLYLLQIENKLNEYIELAQSIIKMQEQGVKCDYYETVLNYTSALIYLYKTHPDEDFLNEIYGLLQILIQDKSISLNESYILVIDILGGLKNKPKYKQKILSLYNSTSVQQFVNTTLPILEKTNTDLQLLNIYKQYVKTLMIYNYSDQGVKLMNKFFKATRTHFNEEVSNITSKHNIDFLTQENEYKLQLIKEKDRLNIFILFVCILIGTLGIFTFKIMQKKNKKLLKLNEEKQFLLKEIHHRIKNNFQIASGMLQLEFHGINHPEIKPLIDQWSSKVNMIISIHKTLYQNDSFKIYLEEHIHNIIQPILHLYKQPLHTYTLHLHKDIILNTNTALNLGVIINELVTNSCKHNNELESLHIEIFCKKQSENYYELTVSDNGNTASNEHILSPGSFGLKLINNFVNKLHGRLEYSFIPNTYFKITFYNH